jgi:aerobic carbon-monoxide dehydrogenase small subunit
LLIDFRLNGKDVSIETAGDRRVVDLLREDFQVAGTKESCGSGDCGACSVLVDGETRLSCLMLAAQLQGRDVVTIEGVSEDGRFEALQEAFIDCGAVQCGFCIPGMILASLNLFKKNPTATRTEIREALSGNLCRCTGYQKIVDAVEKAFGIMGLKKRES